MNTRRERNSKRTRDRRSSISNRDRGRFDEENNQRPNNKRNQKAIGTQRMTDNAPPRPQPIDKATKWKMDEFDEKQAKYDTLNNILVGPFQGHPKIQYKLSQMTSSQKYVEFIFMEWFNNPVVSPIMVLYPSKSISTWHIRSISFAIQYNDTTV